jgi:zinc transporter ZupT
MVAWFLGGGSALFRTGVPPVEKLAFERVVFRPQEIVVLVRNEGAASMTVGQVLVNDAIWDFSISPGRDLERLGTARIAIPYDWIEGEPYALDIVSRTGIRHRRVVDVATSTPGATPGAFALFGLLGLYVGVIPVFLGLLWLPFLRAMPGRWMDFWISLTVGLLLFLGLDTFEEAFGLLGRVPEFLGGFMLIAAGAIAAFLGLTAVDRWMRRARDGAPGADSAPVPGLGLATLIAIGIGLHNLGEGLAIGAAYTLGEAALGSFLIVGFTLHNTTEGLAILSPLAGGRVPIGRLATLGAIGGAPTILGTWTGAFTYSDPLSLAFLGIGGGAILQVIRVLTRARAGDGGSVVEGLARPRSLAGLLLGFLLMYATSLLVAA